MYWSLLLRNNPPCPDSHVIATIVSPRVSHARARLDALSRSRGSLSGAHRPLLVPVVPRGSSRCSLQAPSSAAR